MAGGLEKRWLPAVQAFTSDGDANGIVPVADSYGFYTGMSVAVTASGLPSLYLKVKIVYSQTQISVGPPQEGIDARTNISAYTVAGGAMVAAGMQVKPQIQPPEIFNAVYERDPVTAWRTKLVDQYGQSINASNPLPVNATVTVPPGTIPEQWDDIVLDYDVNNNLIEVQYLLESVLERTLSLTYDVNGNLTGVTATPSP
jgi:hypothetical protein